jgi:hypothetical protein
VKMRLILVSVVLRPSAFSGGSSQPITTLAEEGTTTRPDRIIVMLAEQIG